MRWILLVTLTIAAACSGTAPKPDAAEPAPAAPVADEPVAGAAAQGQAYRTGDGEMLMEAQRAGFKVVDIDGRQLLCRKERQIGSRTRYNTSCMTLEEWEALARSARQTTEDVSRRRMPPRQGDGPGSSQ